tara:strand:+ start:239 stop:1615 length:1377 start_codon:yes stop_codon:yes gene_type:complete
MVTAAVINTDAPSFVKAKTLWHLEFEEEWRYPDPDGRGGFSIFKHRWHTDPIRYSNETPVSVQQFVDKVNAVLESAYDAATTILTADTSTYVKYILEPSVHFPGSIEEAATKKDFIIRYHLGVQHIWLVRPINTVWENAELVRFRLDLREGEVTGYAHSVTEQVGVVPRGRVEFQNYSDTTALVIPLQSRVVSVIDSPPLVPFIDFAPFIGVSNRLLLILNSNTGVYEARPVMIKDSDAIRIASQYSAQGRGFLSPDAVSEDLADPESAIKLQYKNDDPINRYEIFRTTTKPTSYEDFNTADNPYKTISGQISPKKASTMATLIDNIEPNTKYYYCARAIDIHDNFSNPTHVFEAEMVDNEGQVYLILNPILFDAPSGYQNSTSGRKFLYIEPSIRNLEIPSMPPSGSQESDNPGSIFSATEGTSCWNKTFKVRLTSKKSNKKMDLNITFKNTGVINP